jgi:predicted phosphodiesterase
VTPDILFCGDPHGRFDHIIETTLNHKPDAIVLLGDLNAPQPLSQVLAEILEICPVYWIHGNHDTDRESDYDHIYNDPGHPRLHAIHARIATIVGANGSSLRIAGLGGVFRGRVWMPGHRSRTRGSVNTVPAAGLSKNQFLARIGKGNRWRGGLPLKQRSTIFPEHVKALTGEHCDILVTHEAPGSHPHGFMVLDRLAESMKARRIFHGHHHDDIAYPVHAPIEPAPALQAFGVGFRGIMDLHGEVLLRGAEPLDWRLQPVS